MTTEGTPIEDQLSRYIPEHLEDREWIAALCGARGVEEVLRAVARVVRGGDPDAAHSALTFARDLGIYGAAAEEALTDAARAAMPAELFPALEQALYAASHSVRSNAVYTIGKLAFPDQAPLLQAAFEHHRRADALLLPRLIGELFALLPEPDRAYLDALATADHPLIRWAAAAAVDAFSHGPGTAMFELKREVYERLSEDAFDLLREEARYLLAELDGEAGDEPRLMFSDVEVRFLNQLDPRSDYTLEELDAFVQSLRAG